MLATSCRVLLRPLHPSWRRPIDRAAFSTSTAHTQSHQTAYSGIYPTRTHHCGALRATDADSNVVLSGWLLPQRKISNSISFFTIKDSNGITQLVVNRENPQSARVLDELSVVPVESVVLIKGSVRLRPQKAQRKMDPTGEVEVLIHDFTLLNPADHRSMPFLPSASDIQKLPNEELRARFRHLDLRRKALTENLHKRSRVARTIRDVLYDEHFTEIETPLLLKSTPEGAREFLVPTRLTEQITTTGFKEPLFYSLAQSPQQPKQLLICSGAVDKYFQIARCFRDEDGRKDRQPEFTQVDLEMAFVSWGEQDAIESQRGHWRIGGQEVRDVVEKIIRRIWKDVEGVNLPERLPVMTYVDAMARYGSDKPDTRFGLQIVDLTPLLPSDVQEAFSREAQILEGFVVPANDVAFSKASKICRSERLQNVEAIRVNELNQTQWLLGSKLLKEFFPSDKDLNVSSLSQTLHIQPGDTLWLSRRKAVPEGGSTALGHARLRIAQIAQGLGVYTPSTEPHLLWVTAFPLFTRADNDKDFLAKGRWSSSHHPFTAPMWQDVEKLFNGDIASVRGQHYDLVLNGVEIGGGSVRVHDAVMQEHIFSNILQLSEAEKASFDHLLHALRCGAPPHGGIALGFDRLMAMLCGSETIRDVIAFPKTGAGTDVFFKSPSLVNDEVLTQYGIKASR